VGKQESIMPSAIPVGDGKRLICFDQNYDIRDLYFPSVGQENHVTGNFIRLGVWVNDRFSWAGEGWYR
jgi:glucoamylase